MATNRRKYTPKQTKQIPCEKCIDLTYTPIFLEALMKVRNLSMPESGLHWYHQNGHAVFLE